MDMVANIIVRRDDLKRLVGHVLRVGRRETEPHTRMSLGAHGEKLRESYGAIGIVERVNILTEQDGLLKALGIHVVKLLHDGLGVTTSLASSRIRNNAI